MATGRIKASSVASPTGELGLNLPFSILSGTEQSTSLSCAVFVWNAAVTNNGLWTVYSDGGQASIYIRYGNSATPVASANYVQANTEVRFTVTYVTA